MSENRKITTKDLAVMAMLIALNIILSRFLSISAWNIKIGFAFVPVVFAALYLGTWQAALVGALGDFIGANLFPIGAYFPGFTMTAALVGMTYGLCLHKKQNLPRILAAVLITEICGSLLLNTLWISILYGSPFLPLMATRAFQCLLMGIVEVVIIRILAGLVPHLQRTIKTA